MYATQGSQLRGCCAQVLVFFLVALVAGIFTYELAAVKPNWCVPIIVKSRPEDKLWGPFHMTERQFKPPSSGTARSILHGPTRVTTPTAVTGNMIYPSLRCIVTSLCGLLSLLQQR